MKPGKRADVTQASTGPAGERRVGADETGDGQRETSPETSGALSRIGTAPISFGVFGDIALPIEPATLLASIAGAGYGGTELGPPGFLGPETELPSRLDAAGLEAIGAYVPLHLSGSAQAFERDLEQLSLTLRELHLCRRSRAPRGSPAPLAIFADEGDDSLIAQPFRGPEPGLDERAWSLALERLAKARRLADEAGITASFHPHFATYVEKASEIDRLLETTDLGLCLDTGHFLLGGADPIDYLRRHRERVVHVHIKDVALGVFADARARRLPADHPWWNTLCVPLGEGDAELGDFLRHDTLSSYAGWLVIEQDRAPVDAASFAEALADQHRNARWLAQVWQADGAAGSTS